MNTLSIIITLVSVIAGVLQIVLFFKVWGMCDDVRDLRNQQCPEQPSQQTNNGYSGLLIAFLMAIITITLICIVLALQ